MLERVWGKGNTLALLVGMLIGATTLENNMEIPQTVRSRTKDHVFQKLHFQG